MEDQDAGRWLQLTLILENYLVWMKLAKDLSFHLLFLDLLNDVFNYVRQGEYK
jgi:hypothetical protein